jgi:leucyl aminopeptidase
MPFFDGPPPSNTVPIYFVTRETWPDIATELPIAAAQFATSSKFEPTPGACLILPDADGRIVSVLFGLEAASVPYRDPFLPGKLVAALPAGVYRFANAPHDTPLAVLAWALAAYRFDRYKKKKQDQPRLVPPDDVDFARIKTLAAGVTLGRDLINTPANDLGPDALEVAAVTLAAQFGAEAAITLGDDLLKENFPLIHAVGRAAEKPPRLVDFSWGPEDAPKVTLVGKGVSFDTGGLDIKPSSGMILMKKDMGGAATALALAHFIMDRGLPIRLRVLLPIVENAISASAMRPSDVYPSRKGLSVEIGNTDAEGRLILADALALADEDAPELLFDFATLTGAARVALGPDLPPFYTEDEILAAEIAKFGHTANDPVWRLPLWAPYDKLIDSKTADVSNSGTSGFAGSITAALFLKRFVEKTKSWTHFDIYAWTPSAKPGRPEGGEIQVARLLFDLLESRYGARAR